MSPGKPEPGKESEAGNSGTALGARYPAQPAAKQQLELLMMERLQQLELLLMEQLPMEIRLHPCPGQNLLGLSLLPLASQL